MDREPMKLLYLQGKPVRPTNWREMLQAQKDGEEVPEPGYPKELREAATSNHAFEAWNKMWLTEAFRVLKPGGVAKVFAATRTYHRTAKAMAEIGFQIESLEAWVYGCLSEDTEFLTLKDGVPTWVTQDKIQVGDLAYCYSPKEAPVWAPVSEVLRYPYDEMAYRIFSPNTDQLVSRNHRVPVWSSMDRSVTFTEAQELPARISTLVTTEHAEGGMEISYSEALVKETRYKGTVWCVRVPTGAFVARRNGKAFVTGNSGFPKSLNVHKDIQKRVARALGVTVTEWVKEGEGDQVPVDLFGKTYQVTKVSEGVYRLPPELDCFEGYGTALKPAWEPFVVGRKPG